MIHLASSAQKCTIQLQRCTRCPTQLGKWVGEGPVEDEQRSFSLPCLRQVPHFYDTDQFLFSYRISNFQLPTNVEVNFLAQILLLPQMQSAHFQKSGNKQGNFREHKNPHPSPVPSIQSWGVCCFLKVARTAAQHSWRAWRRKSYIFAFGSSKTSKSPFEGEVSQIILSPIEGLYSLKGIPVHNIPFLRRCIVKLCTLFQTQHPENQTPSPNQQHLPVKAKNGSAPPPSPGPDVTSPLAKNSDTTKNSIETS